MSKMTVFYGLSMNLCFYFQKFVGEIQSDRKLILSFTFFNRYKDNLYKMPGSMCVCTSTHTLCVGSHVGLNKLTLVS